VDITGNGGGTDVYQPTATLPVLVRVTQNIVSPEITGFEDNPEDIHRTRYMCRKKAG
jgi:hypothetical protein